MRVVQFYRGLKHWLNSPAESEGLRVVQFYRGLKQLQAEIDRLDGFESSAVL